MFSNGITTAGEGQEPGATDPPESEQGSGSSEWAANLVLTAVGSFLQLTHDEIAKFCVTCAGVQKSQKCIKDTCECLGKVGFLFVLTFSISICAGGAIILSAQDGNVAWAFIRFLGQQIANFLVASSMIAFAMFAYARRAQMKPSPQALGTETGKSKWETPTKMFSCQTAKAPCEMWNLHIGESVTFEDLPKKAPDYNWQVSIWCLCTKYTCYAYEAGRPEHPQTPMHGEFVTQGPNGNLAPAGSVPSQPLALSSMRLPQTISMNQDPNIQSV